MREAYGPRLNLQEASLILHPHANTVAKYFPHTFLSTSQERALAKGGSRPAPSSRAQEEAGSQPCPHHSGKP
eukprot:2984655-Heterocapsa_arctica.AAC.1